MIGNNYSLTTRDMWNMIPGNSTELTYNENNKVSQINFYEGETLIFSQLFTYDPTGNPVKIECVAP